MKHTPTPWAINQDDFMVYTESGKQYCVAQYGECNSVASFPLNREQREANAKLIAAAPDLLLACQKALIHLEHLNIQRGLQEDLRLAIQKATA